MTPAARIAAAADILDTLSGGVAAEQALTRWARQNRYAGSKDRAAVRDHVFDVLRQRETCACLGGGTDGRALVAGLLRAQGANLAAAFTGEGHAPGPLTDAETAAFGNSVACDALWNLPQWLIPEFRRSLGDAAQAAERALRQRAPVTLRVNLARADLGSAQASLQADGIGTQANPMCQTALTVTEGARRLRNATAYTTGLVELQDAASQAVVAGLPEGALCLDYCAGGGGKALALAAQPGRAVHAHDIDPARRARRVSRHAACDRCPVTTGTFRSGALRCALFGQRCVAAITGCQMGLFAGQARGSLRLAGRHSAPCRSTGRTGRHTGLCHLFSPARRERGPHHGLSRSAP